MRRIQLINKSKKMIILFFQIAFYQLVKPKGNGKDIRDILQYKTHQKMSRIQLINKYKDKIHENTFQQLVKI